MAIPPKTSSVEMGVFSVSSRILEKDMSTHKTNANSCVLFRMQVGGTLSRSIPTLKKKETANKMIKTACNHVNPYVNFVL
jgi:hypothetical protein